MNVPQQPIRGAARWQTLPNWEPLLLGPEGLRLGAWLADGSARVVKHGAHRTVYRVETAGRAFYLKQDHPGGVWRSLQHLVRRSAARREWARATEIARRGVATVRPVAWGELRRGGLVRESFLVTEAIEPSSTVEEFALQRLPSIPEPLRRRLRRALMTGFARFVAAVHRAGIRHDDFHAGNVLVRWPSDHDWSSPTLPALAFSLIDVPGVRLGGALEWSASRASLAVVAAAWREQTTRSERLRFWQTYRAERPELVVPDRYRALRQLDAAALAHSRRILRGRDKRALRANRDYQKLDNGRAAVHALCDIPPAFLRHLAEDPEALLRENLHRPIKLSHSSMLVEAAVPTATGTTVVGYKCYRPRNAWKAFCAMFRSGRALRSWYLGQALFERKIPTARPLAICTQRRPRFGRRSYLATAWIEGAENLHLYGWRLAPRSVSERARRARQCADSLGRLVGRMHAWGVRHGDLKASNLLVVESPQTVRAYVIDLDDVRIGRRIPPANSLADLARLAAGLEAHPWVSRTFGCRFLRAYARQFPPGAIDWKALWRQTARACGQITRRKHRRQETVL